MRLIFYLFAFARVEGADRRKVRAVNIGFLSLSRLLFFEQERPGSNLVRTLSAFAAAIKAFESLRQGPSGPPACIHHARRRGAGRRRNNTSTRPDAEPRH